MRSWFKEQPVWWYVYLLAMAGVYLVIGVLLILGVLGIEDLAMQRNV